MDACTTLCLLWGGGFVATFVCAAYYMFEERGYAIDGSMAFSRYNTLCIWFGALICAALWPIVCAALAVDAVRMSFEKIGGNA